MTEKQLLDLNATNGDCIAEYKNSTVASHTIRLLSSEELGDEYIKSRIFNTMIVPVSPGSPFWQLVREVAAAQGFKDIVKAIDSSSV